jgi:hypothetical protein
MSGASTPRSRMSGESEFVTCQQCGADINRQVATCPYCRSRLPHALRSVQAQPSKPERPASTAPAATNTLVRTTSKITTALRFLARSFATFYVALLMALAISVVAVSEVTGLTSLLLFTGVSGVGVAVIAGTWSRTARSKLGLLWVLAIVTLIFGGVLLTLYAAGPTM